MKDYSERRQSRTSAHPKKRPSVWPYVLLILLLMFIAFLSGLGSGWYLYRPGGRFYKTQQIPQPTISPKNQSDLPPQGSPIVPASPQNPSQGGQPAANKGSSAAPPLTFYNTLQKGNKELMGTGINQPKEPQQGTPSKSPSTAPNEH